MTPPVSQPGAYSEGRLLEPPGASRYKCIQAICDSGKGVIEVREWPILAGGALLAMLAACLLGGCMSRREIMQERSEPRNTVLDAAAVLDGIRLQEGENSWFGEWEDTGTQSIYVLLLAPNAQLGSRYHGAHDLTLVCLAGSAIVEVEQERTFLEPPACVSVPRLTAYRIIPHRSNGDFAALAIFSPRFDGRDVKVLDQ